MAFDFSGILGAVAPEPPSLEALMERCAERADDNDVEFTDEHAECMRQIFLEDRNVMVTGGAGVGKTMLVKLQIIAELESRGYHYGVTATTGIAGSHLSGRTIHSYLGIGLGPRWAPGMDPQDMSAEELEPHYEHFSSELIKRRGNHASFKGVQKRLKAITHLILDEVSMMPGNALLGFVDHWLKKIRRSQEPFGGIRMIFVGDALQLAPVCNKGSRTDWSFMSWAWQNARVLPIELTKVFRQKDSFFMDLLNRLRMAEPFTAEDAAYLKSRVLPAAEQTMKTMLCSTNAEADKRNKAGLDSLPGEATAHAAKFTILPHMMGKYDSVAQISEELMRNKPIKDPLQLKVGMPVLITVNAPFDSAVEYFNGSRGTVQFLTPESVTVKLDTGPSVRIGRFVYTHNSDEDPEDRTNVDGKTLPLWPRVEQFPMLPAFAITAHRCVDKSTWVPTMTGMREIGMICESDKEERVAGMEEFHLAQDPFVGEEEPGFRITTARGYSIVCSERHPLMRLSDVGEEWVKAPSLRVGDILRMRAKTLACGDGSLPPVDAEDAAPNSKPYKLPSVMSEDLAWLLGIMTGDGCLTDRRDGRMDVTSMDSEVLGKVAASVGSLFGISTTTKKSPKSRASVVYCHSWGVRMFLFGLGFSFDRGPGKRVPHAILRGTLAQQAAFLRGYFDADGGVNRGVHVTSTSRKLLEDTHLLLLNLGIKASLDCMRTGHPQWLDSYRINITGTDMLEYQRLVGFEIRRKMDRLAEVSPSGRVVPKVNLGRYPGAYVREQCRKMIGELKTAFPSDGIRRNTLSGKVMGPWAAFLRRSQWVGDDTRVTDAHFAAMAKQLPGCLAAGPVCAKMLGEAARGCFLDEIISIEPTTCDSRDICVPEGHAFVGNGFVNHNSQGCSLDECMVDMSRAFAPGQVYVALSRLRTPEGLWLASDGFRVQSDKYAVRFYKLIREGFYS